MKKRNLFWVLALFLLGLLLVACGSSSEPDTETEPDTSAEADSGSEADMSETETEADTVAESGLPDLGGREVTIAVENAYLPFNYIDPDTGEAAGWDYDVWDQICGLINCTPVYVEAGWEGMIQAVADGQYDAAADGITITDDRAEIVDFSNGYINIEQRLLVRSGCWFASTRIASKASTASSTTTLLSWAPKLAQPTTRRPCNICPKIAFRHLSSSPSPSRRSSLVISTP